MVITAERLRQLLLGELIVHQTPDGPIGVRLDPTVLYADALAAVQAAQTFLSASREAAPENVVPSGLSVMPAGCAAEDAKTACTQKEAQTGFVHVCWYSEAAARWVVAPQLPPTPVSQPAIPSTS